MSGELLIYVAILAFCVLLLPYLAWEGGRDKRISSISKESAGDANTPISGLLLRSTEFDGHRVDECVQFRELDENAPKTSAEAQRRPEARREKTFFEIWKPDVAPPLRVSKPSDPAMRRALQSLLLPHVNMTSSRVQLEYMLNGPEDRDDTIQDAIEAIEMATKPSDEVWARWEKRGLDPTTVAGRRAARLLLRFGADRPGAEAVARAHLSGEDSEVSALAGLLLEDAEALLPLLSDSGVPDRLRFRAADFVIARLGRERVVANILEVFPQLVQDALEHPSNRVPAMVEVIDHLGLSAGADVVAPALPELRSGTWPDVLPVLSSHGTRAALTPLIEFRASRKAQSSAHLEAIDQTIAVIRARAGESPAGALALADVGEGQVSLMED